MPSSDARVHVLTHGLHYGSCVFEGERAYDGHVFKSRKHTERLHRSAEIMDFSIPFSVDVLEKAKAEILERNGGGNKYVRAVAFRGGEKMMAVAAQQNPIHVAIATWTWPSMFDPAERMRGIRLDIADYRRPDPACAPAMAKAAGLYMICTISKHRAEKKGYSDALMFDWQGRVAECTGANIFFVQDGKLHTPIADCFLAGLDARDGDRPRQEARHRGRRAPHHAGGAVELHRVLHHGLGRRSDARARDRPSQLPAGPHLRAAARRLHGRRHDGLTRGWGRNPPERLKFAFPRRYLRKINAPPAGTR